jgi:hypothetical protein
MYYEPASRIQIFKAVRMDLSLGSSLALLNTTSKHPGSFFSKDL